MKYLFLWSPRFSFFLIAGKKGFIFFLSPDNISLKVKDNQPKSGLAKPSIKESIEWPNQKRRMKPITGDRNHQNHRRVDGSGKGEYFAEPAGFRPVNLE